MVEGTCIHDPPLSLHDCKLSPGVWVLLDDDCRVALSGADARSVIEEAERLNFDSASYAITRMPFDDEDDLHFDP